MGAAFHDPSVLDDEDEVRGADGRQPVGDHHRGPSGECLGQGRLYRGLGGGVQVCGGLVEDHYPWPCQQEPGDGQALAFAAGQPVAAFADDGLQPVGQTLDEVGEPGAAQRIPQVVLGSLRACQQEVRADRLVEQVPVLGDHPERRADGLGGQLADVDPGQAHRAGVDVVEPGRQLRDRGLPGARRAHQRHQLPGFDPERHVMENLDTATGVEHGDLLQRCERDLVRGRVAETDVVEFHRHPSFWHPLRVRAVCDQRFEVQHLEHPFEAYQSAHDFHPGAGQRGQRGVEAGEQQRERDDGAGFQLPAQRVETTEPVDEGECQRRDQGQRGDEHPLHHRRAYSDVTDPPCP